VEYHTSPLINVPNKYIILYSQSQDDWPQFHHICYWELYWATMMSQQWGNAIHYADLLLKESKWSRCMYSYQKAAIMCMVQDDLTEEQMKEQKQLME